MAQIDIADVQSWDRQPGETMKAFAAFTVFRDMGSDRSIRKAFALAKKLPYKRTGAAGFSKWSQKYDWFERAAKFDAYQDKVKQQQIEDFSKADAEKWKKIREHQRKRDVNLGSKMMKVAARLASKGLYKVERVYKEEIQEGGKTIIRHVKVMKPARWNMNTVARLAEAGSKLVRAGANMPTHVAEEQQTEVANFWAAFWNSQAELSNRIPNGAFPSMPTTEARPKIVDPTRPHEDNGNGNGHGKPFKPKKLRP